MAFQRENLGGRDTSPGLNLNTHQERGRRMIKKIYYIGVLCLFNVMVLAGASTSYAINWSGWLLSAACLTVSCPTSGYFIDLSIFFKGINTDAKDYTFTAVIQPMCNDPDHPFACVLYNWNPGSQGNYQSESLNFANLIPVETVGNITNFDPNQKGKGSGSTILGDCDFCDDPSFNYNLPQDGLLWLLFDYLEDANGNAVPSCVDSEKKDQDPPDYGWGTADAYWGAVYEDCIKDQKLLDAGYIPGVNWQPVGTKFSFINVYIDAFENGVLALQADLENCELDETDLTYSCQNVTVRRNNFVERTF